MIKIQRVYESRRVRSKPFFRVARLWPRGIKKEKLQACTGVKEAAPSKELRKW